MGAQRRDPGGRLVGEPGLADDLDVALGLEQLAQSAADHLVVVEQEHAQGLAVTHGTHASGTAQPERANLS
jgi:hypothetical protein